ncbi:MAG: DNA primase [Erysipelotrichaceae bacterium]
MPKIDPSIIDDIRKNVNIADVIEHYVPVVRRGRSVRCVCPFHDDHDPSLSISEEKQIYKCFVCEAAGNVFSFVQDFENISFLAAVKKVSEIANIPFDYEISTKRIENYNSEFDRYYNIMADSCNFFEYQLQLPTNKKYLNYLLARGLDETLIKKFKIGYNPHGDVLNDFLLKKKYHNNELVKVNLINENGSDVFKDRITFPLIDQHNNVVGYTARSLNGNTTAKYINTATSNIYQKSNLVYNYLVANPACKKMKKVIVCEGVMDVIAFAKVGINHVVATLGTACTIEQLKQIRRLSSRIIIFYDGDNAGQNATYRLGQIASENNIIVEMVDNHTILDPDDIIAKHSAAELELMSDKTLHWIEFLLKYLPKQFGISNFAQKERIAREIGSYIQKLNDENAQKYFSDKLFELTGINYNYAKVTIPTEKRFLKPEAHDSEIKKQKSIISQLTKSSEAICLFQNELGFLPDERLNRLAVLLVSAYNNKLSTFVDEAAWFSVVEQKELRELLSEIMHSDQFEKEYSEKILLGAINSVKRAEIQSQIRRIRMDLAQTLDPKKQEEFAKKILELKRKEVESKEA